MPHKSLVKRLSLILSFMFVLGNAFTQSDYQQVLNLGVKFYGAQRSGTKDSNWITKQYPATIDIADSALAVAAPDFLMDGNGLKPTKDLSGGWHDAGDCLKFTINGASTVYTLLKAFDAYPKAFPDLYDVGYNASPNGIPDVLDEVKWETDWLLKANYKSGVLVSAIGDAREYNYAWTCPSLTSRPDSEGGQPRPVYFGGDTNGTLGQYSDSTRADIMGITSAALSLMSRIYRPYNSAYADTCLAHAKDLYATAKIQRGISTQAEQSYPIISDTGNIACAAIELYRATNDTSILNEALAFEAATGTGTSLGSPGWRNPLNLCRHSLAKVNSQYAASAKTRWQSVIDSYKNSVGTQTYINGLAYLDPWGSLAASTEAAFAASLFQDVYANTDYNSFIQGQANYVIGTNEYNRSFVIGYGNNAPKSPQHINAWGRNEWYDDNDTSTYTLFGALVGGPHDSAYINQAGDTVSPAGYQDNMNDYVANEVAIDYNAGLVGAMAAAYTISPSTAILNNPTPQLSYSWNGNSLSLNSTTPFQAELYRLDGQLISRTPSGEVNQLNWSLPELSSGAYLLVLHQGSQSHSYSLPLWK